MEPGAYLVNALLSGLPVRARTSGDVPPSAVDLAMTSPRGDGPAGQGGEPPDVTVRPVVAGDASEGATWALAFLPFATLLGYAFAAVWDVSLGPVSVATLVASSALVITDKRGLVRTGRVPSSSTPSTAWLLFPPGYLFRRARVLGAPRTQAWIAVACFVAAFIGRTALVAKYTEAPTGADPVLPACAERAIMQDVLNVFDGVGAIRTTGVRGVTLTEQTEIGQGPGPAPNKKYCTGKVEASNTQDYQIEYDLELQQGQVIVRVELQQ